MQSLNELYTKFGEEKLRDFLNKNSFQVYEKIDSPKFFLKKEMGIIKIYKGQKNKLKLIDKDSIMNMWKYAFGFIESLPQIVKDQIKEGLLYKFNIIDSDKPNYVQYKRPKSNIILSVIFDSKSNKPISDIGVLEYVSNIMNVDYIHPIFNTYFNKLQIDNLIAYVKGDIKVDNFSNFIYDLLSPDNTDRISLRDGYVDSFIFNSNDDNTSFNLVDTYIASLKELEHAEKFNADSNDILVVDFITYVNGLNFNKLDVKNKTYIDLFCELFNSYYLKRENDLKNYEIVYNKCAFDDTNILDKIKNEKTLNIIKDDTNKKVLFLLLYGSLKDIKKLNPKNNILNSVIISIQNSVCNTIKQLINAE